MLQARLGRRISEILIAGPGPAASAARQPGRSQARHDDRPAPLPADQDRRAPDTILVDAEIVAIIRAQQDWAATGGGFDKLPCRSCPTVPGCAPGLSGCALGSQESSVAIREHASN
jgi:hypothetical protein